MKKYATSVLKQRDETIYLDLHKNTLETNYNWLLFEKKGKEWDRSDKKTR